MTRMSSRWKEIGDKYNLSRERIRQLQEQALGKIRKACGQLVLKVPSAGPAATIHGPSPPPRPEGRGVLWVGSYEPPAMRVTNQIRPATTIAAETTRTPCFANQGRLRENRQRRQHHREHRELTELHTRVEQEERRRHVSLRKRDLSQRPREAEAVDKAEREGDSPALLLSSRRNSRLRRRRWRGRSPAR